MKVLVTSTPGLGHILPMVPLVRELHERGHALRWVGGHVGLDDLREVGVEVHEAGIPEAERHQELARRFPDPPPGPRTDWQRWAFPRVFAEIAAPAMLGPVRSAVDGWGPDVVLHDAAELAGPLAAAAAGIPSVCHGFGQLVPEAAVLGAGEALAPVWRASGLAPDRYAGSYRDLYVDIYPPSLGSEASTHVPHVQRCRPADGTEASGTTVYVTFGTLFNHDLGLLRAAVLAAAALADDVVVTTGRNRDPGLLGPVPGNVRVEAFIAQADLLPHSAAVVCHGGSGTVLAALAHGIPVVCVPQGADQFANAANIVRVGAGAAVEGEAADTTSLTSAIGHVLGAEGPRHAAAGLAREIADMPGAGDLADAIEELVGR